MENYYPLEEIADGNHSVVWLMRHKDTHDLVAVKCTPRGDKINEKMAREIINHKSLCHPNIIQFKEAVLTPTHLAIVMQQASGDLFDYLKGYGRFNEDQARYFFQQLISGISFCHNMEICHRDLKLENLLLVGRCLKICDFGFSKSYLLHSRPKSKLGTPAYVAPEVLSCKEYDGKMADIWSCGVILYSMLVGAFPFEDKRDPQNIRKTIQQIASVQYKFPTDVHLSQGCINLISRIFVANPSERITMKEIKSHPWFLKNLPKDLTEEALSVYYKKGKPTTSLQNTEDINNIVNMAKTLPTACKSKPFEFGSSLTQPSPIM